MKARAIGVRLAAWIPVIVLLSWLTNSGCVLPVGPQFQDPPAAQNYAPTFTNVNPVNGKIVTTTTFSVTFVDPNLSDDLHVEWIADYPPYTANTRSLIQPQTLPHSMTATTPVQQDSSVMVDCAHSNLAPGLTQHQIMVIVADREFLSPDAQPQDRKLTALPDGAGSVEAHWILTLECK